MDQKSDAEPTSGFFQARYRIFAGLSYGKRVEPPDGGCEDAVEETDERGKPANQPVEAVVNLPKSHQRPPAPKHAAGERKQRPAVGGRYVQHDSPVLGHLSMRPA